MFKLDIETKIPPRGGSGGPGGSYIGVKWYNYRYSIFTFSQLLKHFGPIVLSYGL